jgi:hypothetical protein
MAALHADLPLRTISGAAGCALAQTNPCSGSGFSRLSAFAAGDAWDDGSGSGRASVQPVLRELAEYPNSFGPLGPRDERIETERYTLCMGLGNTWNTVQRQRFRPEEVDDVLEEVRSLLRARGRSRTQWEVGSSAAPPELVDLLLARGLIRDKDPYTIALVLTEKPPQPAAGIVARRVETFEEYAAANEVQWQAFEMPEDEVAEARTLLPQRWHDGPIIVHAVWLDLEIVSAGTSAPTPHGLLLYGGATVSRARGRGAYRALLRARWDEAVARGTPALITQGGSMSRPILESVGFEPVGHVHVLLDDFSQTPGASHQDFAEPVDKDDL